MNRAAAADAMSWHFVMAELHGALANKLPDEAYYAAHRAVVLARRFRMLDCQVCLEPGDFKPSHFGSSRCRSGAMAAGGNGRHCTCDTCF